MVTLRLDLFIDILLGSKDYAIVDPEVRDAIMADPSHTEHVYIEQIRDNLYKVWRLKYWKISVEREQKIKEIADRRRQRLLDHRDALERASKLLSSKTGTDVDTAKLFIKTLFANPNGRTVVKQLLPELTSEDVETVFDYKIETEPLPNL